MGGGFYREVLSLLLGPYFTDRPLLIANNSFLIKETMKSFRKKLWHRLMSDRGSTYMEYAMLTAMVFVGAIAAFSPGSFAFRALGADFAFRSLLIRLPIF